MRSKDQIIQRYKAFESMKHRQGWASGMFEALNWVLETPRGHGRKPLDVAEEIISDQLRNLPTAKYKSARKELHKLSLRSRHAD